MSMAAFLRRVGRIRPAVRLGALLVLTVAVPCAAGAQERAAPEARRPVVTVVAATRGEIIVSVPVSGTLVAREEIFVNPQINGYEIEAVGVDIGDRVEKGTVLATLDTAALDAALAQAEADVTRAEATVAQAQSQITAAGATQTEAQSALARATALLKSGTTTQASVDQAQANADTAAAQVAANQGGLGVATAQVAQAEVARDLARLNRSRADILAPEAGIVSARTANVGLIAAAGGQPLFTILKDGAIEMEAEVIETDLGQVAIGDAAQIDVAGIGLLGGAVRLVSPVVDAQTRLGTVRIAFEGAAGLRTGLFGAGAIVTDRHEALSLPVPAVLSSVVDGALQDVVKVVADAVVETRVVQTGVPAGGRREILSGLGEGETVLARAAAFFRDGDTVTPIAAPSPDAPPPDATPADAAPDKGTSDADPGGAMTPAARPAEATTTDAGPSTVTSEAEAADTGVQDPNPAALSGTPGAAQAAPIPSTTPATTPATAPETTPETRRTTTPETAVGSEAGR